MLAHPRVGLAPVRAYAVLLGIDDPRIGDDGIAADLDADAAGEARATQVCAGLEIWPKSGG